jgi:dolichol-phosphate mannosyltransferase
MTGSDHDSRKLISLVVPVFNEEQNIEPFHQALAPVLSGLAHRYDFELLFTDNHSTDATFEKLEDLSRRDQRVRVIRFSRNFGYQRSIYTGYLHARGAAAIQIDCDLQDPPGLIVEFLEKWEAGYQVVYGVRRSRQESRSMNFARRVFYRLINLLSEDELPLDAGDFRLVDRRVLEVLGEIGDCQPYLRGIIAAVGFRQIGILYDRSARTRGESKFSWNELVQLATDGILSHSTVPLRAATVLGSVAFAAAVLGFFGYLIGRFALGRDWPAGFATIILTVLLSLALNSLLLGIIGEYVGRMCKQVRKQPLTIIETELNPPTGLPQQWREAA